MKALVVPLLTAILLSGNCVSGIVRKEGGWVGGNREEGRANVFRLGYYLHHSQE